MSDTIIIYGTWNFTYSSATSFLRRGTPCNIDISKSYIVLNKLPDCKFSELYKDLTYRINNKWYQVDSNITDEIHKLKYSHRKIIDDKCILPLEHLIYCPILKLSQLDLLFSEPHKDIIAEKLVLQKTNSPVLDTKYVGVSFTSLADTVHSQHLPTLVSMFPHCEHINGTNKWLLIKMPSPGGVYVSINNGPMCALSHNINKFRKYFGIIPTEYDIIPMEWYIMEGTPDIKSVTMLEPTCPMNTLCSFIILFEEHRTS